MSSEQLVVGSEQQEARESTPDSELQTPDADRYDDNPAGSFKDDDK